MSKKLVSIIIPCFNQARYLEEAVKSCINQSYRPIEIIIVDDESPDATKEVARKLILNFSKESQEIKYHFQENKGLSGARNAGLKLASGEYICLLDADDKISSLKLAEQTKFLDANPNVDIVYGRFRFFLDPGCLLGSRRETFDHYPTKDMLFHLLKDAAVFMPVHTTLIRKSVFNLVGKFDESIKSIEDVEFWLRCCLAGISFDFQNQLVALYRIRKASMSLNVKKMNKAFLEVLSSVDQKKLKLHEIKALNNQISDCHLMLALSSFLIDEDKRQSNMRIKASLTANNFNVKAWFFFIVSRLPFVLSSEILRKVVKSEGLR